MLMTGFPAIEPTKVTVPSAAASTACPGSAARSTPRWPDAHASAGGSNPRCTTGDPLSGQPAGVGSRTAPTAGAGIANDPEADHDEEWRLDKSTEGSHAGSLRMSRHIVRPCAHLWMTVEGPLAFVDRLVCADLPSGLTSHARVPAFGLGGTFGLDLD